MVDADPETYPTAALRQFKTDAEARARAALGQPDHAWSVPSIRLTPASDRDACCYDILLAELRLQLQKEGACELYPADLPVALTLYTELAQSGQCNQRLWMNPDRPLSEYYAVECLSELWENDYSAKVRKMIASRLAHCSHCDDDNNICRTILYKQPISGLTVLHVFILHCDRTPVAGESELARMKLYNPQLNLATIDYMSDSAASSSLDTGAVPALRCTAATPLHELGNHVRQHGVQVDDTHSNYVYDYTKNSSFDVSLKWYDQLEVADEWLVSHCRPTNEFNYTTHSGQMKHDVERWAKAKYNLNPCVSNDAMVFSLLRQNYRVKKIDENPSRVYANVKFM